MFEAAEVGHRTGKQAYERKAPALRAELLDVQRTLAGADGSAVILVAGAEGAGKEDMVALLLEWMDARGIETHALGDVTDEERERPPWWRFWRVLPPRGKMAILFGAWYAGPMVARVFGDSDDARFEREMRRIVDFEQMLANENVLVVKFWLHLAKELEKKRLKKARRDPRLKWRINPNAWRFLKAYDAFRAVSEDCIRLTSSGFAPWHIVESEDPRFRNLTVTATLLQAIHEGLGEWSRRAAERAQRGRPALPRPREVNIIRQLDLTQRLSPQEYDTRLARYQGRLAKRTRKLHDSRRSLVLVFEGPDAAGKGGAIRRLTGAIDPRLYQEISIAAPSDEEEAHPYLWRFWRQVPRRGRITIYDRSWYGRVLVERIEGLCAPDDWRRAYAEINAFEEQLVESGTVMLKFWLAISPAEQLRRFKARQKTPYKQYKLTEEDWRNRSKWNAYEAAAVAMIERTSTDQAPWVLVEANDKHWARIKILRTVCRRLKAALD